MLVIPHFKGVREVKRGAADKPFRHKSRYFCNSIIHKNIGSDSFNSWRSGVK